MIHDQKLKKISMVLIAVLFALSQCNAQNLSEFNTINSENLPASTIQNKIQINGYTNN